MDQQSAFVWVCNFEGRFLSTFALYACLGLWVCVSAYVCGSQGTTDQWFLRGREPSCLRP